MSTPRTQADRLAARCRRLLADHRARARRDGAALDHVLADLLALLGSSPLCDYCRSPLSFAVQLDHKTPTARGGRHALDNLAPCCDRCNALKGQLDAAEFAELRRLLARLHPAAVADLARRLLAGGARYRGNRREPDASR